MTTLARKRTTVREIIAAMSAYTLEIRPSEIKLNQNESPFDLPAEIKQEVLARVAGRPWNRYPDFEAIELRSAIANAFALNAENILAGNGSNELLGATIGAFVGPGRPVIFPRPTFTLYEKLVTIAGGIPMPIDFDPSTGMLPLDEMLGAIESSGDAIVIVCSPNNPTGGVLPGGGLQQLLDTGVVVLLDRAYGDFEQPLARPSDCERLVTFCTFSKAWGLAGLRIGWLTATAEICRQVRKVKLPYNLNIISEAIAIAAIEHRELRDRNVAAIVSERERVAAEMARISAIRIFPSFANFIAFRTPDAKHLFSELWQRGVLVRDVSRYPRMQECLRVSIGSREENDRFLTALKESV
jgi:histidinol-phosphate aminotransferase